MQPIRKSLLDLPADIRERIYLDAGLISDNNLSLGLRFGMWNFLWNPTIQLHSVTRNLLQACRSISAHVRSIILTRNTLIVARESAHDALRILRRLSQEECRSIRHLFVHLHVQDSLHDGPGSEVQATTLPPERIVAWQATARHLLSQISPGTLTLHLISDTGDSSETRAICQPLLEFPGKLKDCELRLGSKQQHHLSVLASSIVTRIRGGDPDTGTSPFRFLDLPAEIRRHILEYTDLVTPYGQVRWNQKKGFHVVFRFRGTGYMEHGCSHRHHCACRRLFCTSVTSIVTGSFCRSRRSAYSSHCHCWAPPKAFMSVSRVFYQHAIDVFYSHNNVTIMPSKGATRSVCTRYSLLRLDASRFITRHMWPEVLRHIHSLELILPLTNSVSCPEFRSPLYLDWCFAIAHLKCHANLDKLKLIVYSLVDAPRGFKPSPLIHADWNVNAGPPLLLEAHTRLLTPLQFMRPIKYFFVFLEWWWHWTPEHLAPSSTTEISSHDAFAATAEQQQHWAVVEMEFCLERTVMGDGYDSLAVGKAKERQSVWMFDED